MDDVHAFEEALKKYGFLMLDEPDLEEAKKVEEAQLLILRRVRGAIDLSKGLEEVIDSMEADGSLSEAAEEIADALGWQAPAGGDSRDREVVPVVLAIQAVARAYAEEYERKNGVVEWEGDRCPLCGTESDAMVVEGDRYYMICPLCGYKWLQSEGSLRCPRCGEEVKLGVYSDKSGLLGLAKCQGCGHTWHIVLGDIDAPRIVIPLIAMGAERFRRALPDLK